MIDQPQSIHNHSSNPNILPVSELNDLIRHNLEQYSDNLELEFNKCAQSLFPCIITLLSSWQLDAITMQPDFGMTKKMTSSSSSPASASASAVAVAVTAGNTTAVNMMTKIGVGNSGDLMFTPQKSNPAVLLQSSSSNGRISELPNPLGQAGGATTSALLKVLYSEENRVALGELSYLEVMKSMRQSMSNTGTRMIKKQVCVPLLSSSRPIVMNEPFQFLPRVSYDARKRALLIGINYSGQEGELSGCHNDVMNMKEYIMDSQGFKESDITILMDYGDFEDPTHANILKQCRKLVSESLSGDLVLFHFSGHGGRLLGQSSKYEDTLIPSDHEVAGHINDEDLFQNLICSMAPGVYLSCLIDCCHSGGPVFDLPFYYQHQVDDKMRPNEGMNFRRLSKLSSTARATSRRLNSEHKYNSISNMTCFKNEIPSIPHVIEYALLSRLVYKVRSKDSSVFQKGEVSKLRLSCNFFFEDNTGFQVMIVTSSASKYVAVVFRGTDEWRDWNENRKVLFTNFGPKEKNSLKLPWHLDQLVKVHRGFNYLVFGGGRFQKLIDALEKTRRENPGYKVVFTGHSLGAACATIAGAYTAWSMPDCQVSVVNYGSPRIGNAAFKEWIEDVENISIWRFAHQDDIITKLPPAFIGYQHVGHLIDLEQDGARAYYRHIGDSDLGLVSAPEWKWNALPSSMGIIRFCTDHLCSQYVDYLNYKSSQNPEKYYTTKFEDMAAEKLEKFWGYIFPSPNELRKLGMV